MKFVHRTPFTNKRNAFKRLIRYHVFHELDPSPDELEKEEDELETRAEQLLTKFHQMINKYHYLLRMVISFYLADCPDAELCLLNVQESTKEAPASEFVMVERMFVGEEKQSLEKLKEEARVAKELQLTPVWPVKTEPDAETGPVEGATAVQQTLLINGKRESSPEIHQPAKATLKTQPKVSSCLPHAKIGKLT